MLSVQAVRCQHVRFLNNQSGLFANFRISCRGNIRKAPSCLTWVECLASLRKKGDVNNPGAILQQWNRTATKEQQIVGTKSQAVKNLMELCPPEGLRLIFEANSALSWDQLPFSEEGFASKRIYPGQGDS